jgi:hypothetical protein
MAKTEVYSWRVAPELKAALERAARRESISLADLLDRLATDWLSVERKLAPADEDEQSRLRASAAAVFGSIAGGDARRSEKARRAIRKRLARKRAS